jgi:hypothetical protein
LADGETEVKPELRGNHDRSGWSIRALRACTHHIGARAKDTRWSESAAKSLQEPEGGEFFADELRA